MTTAKFETDKITHMLAQQTVFGELLLPAERQRLLDHSQVRHVAAGEVLCQQQQNDSRVFILLLGEVVVTEAHSGRPVTLARLQRGELFGEIAALFHLPRISTVAASRPAVVLDIPGAVFEDVVSQRAALRDAVWQRYHRRLSMTVLRMVDPFRYLPEAALASLLARLSLVSYAAGHRILDAGVPGDALYVVISGEVIVSQPGNETDQRLATLSAGDYFGEWSMLTGAPCSATVTANGQVSLLCIERLDFLCFIQEYPSVRDGIDQVAHNRQGQAGGVAGLHSRPAISTGQMSGYY
ncbi:MAG: cyclic nucleotide-binding domain-containing protein [Gammaproteobacteria bacterium]